MDKETWIKLITTLDATVIKMISNDGMTRFGAKLKICPIYKRDVNELKPPEKIPVSSISHREDTLDERLASSPDEYFLKKDTGKVSTRIMTAAWTDREVLMVMRELTCALTMPISFWETLAKIMKIMIACKALIWPLCKTAPVKVLVILVISTPILVITKEITNIITTSDGLMQSFIYKRRSMIFSFFNGRG